MRPVPVDAPWRYDTGAVVAIGVFDGVHRGHQHVIKQTVELARARGLRSVVVTFDPTPAEVLAPDRAPKLLTLIDERADYMKSLGVDEVRVVEFTPATSREEARDFVARALVGHCRAKVIVVGEDFHFGKDRGGNVTTLTEWSAVDGFETVAVALRGDGERFSSTRIRTLLTNGDVATAADILGRPFAYASVEVVHGDARGGAELGYPTANIAPSPRLIRPALGIYAGRARLADGRQFAAAISVGQRPQFYEEGELLIEAHLLSFTGDLYGTRLSLDFFRYLRPELTFSSVDELVTQMGEDVALTAVIYGESGAGSA